MQSRSRAKTKRKKKNVGNLASSEMRTGRASRRRLNVVWLLIFNGSARARACVCACLCVCVCVQQRRFHGDRTLPVAIRYWPANLPPSSARKPIATPWRFFFPFRRHIDDADLWRRRRIGTRRRKNRPRPSLEPRASSRATSITATAISRHQSEAVVKSISRISPLPPPPPSHRAPPFHKIQWPSPSLLFEPDIGKFANTTKRTPPPPEPSP